MKWWYILAIVKQTYVETADSTRSCVYTSIQYVHFYEYVCECVCFHCAITEQCLTDQQLRILWAVANGCFCSHKPWCEESECVCLRVCLLLLPDLWGAVVQWLWSPCKSGQLGRSHWQGSNPLWTASVWIYDIWTCHKSWRQEAALGTAG